MESISAYQALIEARERNGSCSDWIGADSARDSEAYVTLWDHRLAA